MSRRRWDREWWTGLLLALEAWLIGGLLVWGWLRGLVAWVLSFG